MSSNDESKTSGGLPAHLFDEVPLPDDEWAPGASSAPPVDVPPPDEYFAPIDEDSGPPPSDLDSAPSSPPTRPSKPSPNKTPQQSGDRAFGRGVEAKIVGGTEGVGVVGEIFWWGESKFGEGMRAGVRGPGDKTYWVDEEHLGWPDDDVPDDVIEAAKEASKMGKGDRVRVIAGKETGTEGVIFWWGESKWGDGMRAGIETDDGETVWAGSSELELLDAPDAPEADDDIPF